MGFSGYMAEVTCTVAVNKLNKILLAINADFCKISALYLQSNTRNIHFV